MYANKFTPLILLAALITICLGSCKNTVQNEGETDVSLTQNYNKTSTVLSLAWVSYVNSGMQSTPDKLQAHATAGVNNILTNSSVIEDIGTWNTIWGPVNYTNDTTKCGSACEADNTMMLLKGKDPDDLSKDMYVVSIAGTNFTSIYDWEQEDFLVTTMAKWPAPPVEGQTNLNQFSSPATSNNPDTTGGAPYISLGINTGLDNLFNQMIDTGGVKLIDKLKDEFQNQTTPVELAVTGHSLGGGLSPCVALALKENQSFWNSSSNVTITTYPFAGQTPGNSKFQSHFFTKINASDFQGHYNQYDVVPKGFNINDMNQIAGLYDGISSHLANQCVIEGIIGCVEPNISSFDYTSLYSNSNQFAYSVTYSDTSYQNALKGYSNAPWGTCFAIDAICEYSTYCDSTYARTVNFGAMASIQHLNGYIDSFKIQSVVEVIKANQEPGPIPSYTPVYCNSPLFAGCTGRDSYCKLPEDVQD